MGKRSITVTYLVFLLLLAIVFFGLILLIFNLKGKLFLIEIIIFSIFLFITFVASFGIYSGSRWGFSLLSILFALLLFDLLGIYYFTRQIEKIFFMTVLTSAIGFIASISNIEQGKEEYKSMPKSEKKVEVSHKPGKYIASKTGSSYHAPKCDWAKKIKDNNRVWYDTEEEVKEAGLKKHSCLD